MKKKPFRLKMKRVVDACLSSQALFLMSTEIVIGIILSLFSLVTFLEFAHTLFEQDLAHFDYSLSLAVYTLRTPVLTQLMLFFSFVGADVTLILSCIFTIVMLIKKHKNEAILFSLTLAIGALLNLIFKSWTQRPRPLLSPLIHAGYYSFPSGHAMNSFIFFTLLSYFSFHFFRKRTVSAMVSGVSVCVILLIGFSRIYLGVHYPTDVIAGYLAGFWWFVTALLLERVLVFFRLFKKNEST